MDESKHNKCDEVRELLMELVDSESMGIAPDKAATEIALVDGEKASQHVENCSSCQTWKSQTIDILNVARALPQFDVSESLTQSILRSVETENKTSQQRLAWVVYAAAVSLFLFLILFVDAYESVWGIGSWVVGLATMIVLKMLITEPQKERQVT